MNSDIDSTLVPIQKPVQNRLLKAAGIRKEVATMRATMTLFILPLLILASACGGQEGSPDTGNDDRPIVESTLPPTTDAGMVPETDAGTMPAPDAEIPPVECPPPGLPLAGDMMCGADERTRTRCVGEYTAQDGECLFTCLMLDGNFVFDREPALLAARWCSNI